MISTCPCTLAKTLSSGFLRGSPNVFWADCPLKTHRLSAVKTRTFSCFDQHLCMAFAQIKEGMLARCHPQWFVVWAYRRSLPNIVVLPVRHLPEHPELPNLAVILCQYHVREPNAYKPHFRIVYPCVGGKLDNSSRNGSIQPWGAQHNAQQLCSYELLLR